MNDAKLTGYLKDGQVGTPEAVVMEEPATFCGYPVFMTDKPPDLTEIVLTDGPSPVNGGFQRYCCSKGHTWIAVGELSVSAGGDVMTPAICPHCLADFVRDNFRAVFLSERGNRE